MGGWIQCRVAWWRLTTRGEGGGGGRRRGDSVMRVYLSRCRGCPKVLRYCTI